MQQNHIAKINEYLPEINAETLNFDLQDSEPYEQVLNNFTESILSWSHTVLEKAKLPIAAHEARALTTKYGLDKEEGCALRAVIELEALNKSIAIQDATTATLASMKLLESLWYSSLFRIQPQAASVDSRIAKPTTTVNKSSTANPSSESDHIRLYQETINDLRDKYPHCNINALRLLAATRLNIGKQELDDLDITPT